ncbi:hypothetical protein QYE76_027973 [Lolium multiflorum]|uniref:Uncharacterized protein n=1 Tax=Lolium multiflorum TaxID=4521 RepID=A0AAD8QL07_LOLMU|nr:hypothetical protein QYE76_027973 [Lolium multiflorum]
MPSYLSCYATFMEAYIGIRPTRETFARFFSLRINSVQGKEIPKPKPPVECGSCIVGSRQGSPFFKFTGLESCRAWQGTFFYVKNNGRANLIDLPPFQVGPPSRANWSYNPKTDHAETNRVVRFMASLKKETNICSDDIIRTFISRRVLPLKRRAHRMSEMYGPGDPTKITGRPLSKKDVVRQGPLPPHPSRATRIYVEAPDSFDPDPYIFWKDLKMGKTPAARLGRSPPKPTGSSDDLTMLEAGSESVDKLWPRAKRTSSRHLMPVPARPPPSKRFRTEPLGEKEVGMRRYGRKQMPTASGFRKDLNPSSSFKPGTIWCRQHLCLPFGGHNKFGACGPFIRSPFSTNHSQAAPGAPPAKTSGASSTAPPPKTSKLIKGKATASSAPSGGQQPLVLHVSKAARDTATKATGLLGRITEFQRRGRDLGHLLPYAQKWNAADMTPATRGLGKDRLPAPDPVGDRSSEEHFMRLRSAVKELDSAWYDATNNLMLTADARKALFEELLWEHRELAEAHDKCQVIPEASIEALKEQLAAAQREKDQLIRRHQEELSAQKTSYQELKSQLIQLGLDHAKALKAAEADAAAKMDEALEDASNATVVLRAELEELAKARKGAEEKAARLEEEHKECNQLILQTDTLAYRLFPDSQTYAVKKVRWHALAISIGRVTRRLCGPSLGGTSASRSSRLFPALRCCPSLPAGVLDVNTFSHARGQASTSTTSPSTSEMADGTPVTYEDLTDELKKKYDEIKVILEADLIGSFHRTRSQASGGRGSRLTVRSME